MPNLGAVQLRQQESRGVPGVAGEGARQAGPVITICCSAIDLERGVTRLGLRPSVTRITLFGKGGASEGAAVSPGNRAQALTGAPPDEENPGSRSGELPAPPKGPT